MSEAVQRAPGRKPFDMTEYVQKFAGIGACREESVRHG